MNDQIGEIRSQLESIAERLADLSMVVLRDAIEAGAGQRPPADKTLSQARRAIEKAVGLLDRTELDP